MDDVKKSVQDSAAQERLPSALEASRCDRSPLDGRSRETGAVGWGVLWLLGIPIPILVALFVLRGCT